MDDEIPDINWKNSMNIIKKKITIHGKEYIFAPIIFQTVTIILLIIAITVLYTNDFDKSTHLYIKCDSIIGCENPFYNNTLDCEKKIFSDVELCNNNIVMLPYGFEYGRPPPLILEWFWEISIGFIIIGFIINHLVFNRGFNLKYLFKDEGDKHE